MSLKKQAVSGIKWNFLQQFSVHIVNFGVQVVLARLLMPEMFGLIAMIVVFISIGQVLMDGGMTSSLIRTNEPNQADYSTVFFTNLLMSIAVYGLVYVLAPFIAAFYHQDSLTEIVRVFSLTFVIRALVAVHIAKLTKEMNFKLQMKLQIPSTIIAGIVGISMAYLGYGVWSLVWLNLAQAIVFSIQNWIFISWRPSLIFDWNKFKYHFLFGYKLTLASLIDVIYNDAYRIIIGKFFSPSSVGYFHHAETMRLFPVQQISSVLGKVTYPLFSNIDNDKVLKAAYRTTMKLVFLMAIPTMLSLVLVAEEGFRFLFGSKWLPAVQYFQVLAFASIVRPASAYNLNILKVKGRSDILLKVEIIKKTLGVLLIIISLPFQVIGLVYSLTIFSIISFLINMHYSGRLIGYSIQEQIKDIIPLITLGGVVFCLLLSVKINLFFDASYDFLIIILFTFAFILLFFLIAMQIDKEIFKVIKSINRK